MKRTSRAAQSARWLAAASVVFAVVAATGATAPATADPSPTVSGTVSRADGGSPEGIVVATYCDDDDSGSAGYGSSSTEAAADGSYSLALLPSYSACPSVLLEFHDPTGTYAPQYNGGVVFDYEATSVRPAAGDTPIAPETLSHVAGAISGRVFNTYGHRVNGSGLQVRANGNIFEDAISAPLMPIGPKGGFVLPGLLPSSYVVEVPEGTRYAAASTPWTSKQLIRVTAGKTATSPRLVLKDRPRIQFRATWHARSVTLRIRVTSRVTGKPAVGQLTASVRNHDAQHARKHIRLRHGRATVTLPVASSRAWEVVSVDYFGSRHVADHGHERIYRF